MSHFFFSKRQCKSTIATEICITVLECSTLPYPISIRTGYWPLNPLSRVSMWRIVPLCSTITHTKHNRVLFESLSKCSEAWQNASNLNTHTKSHSRIAWSFNAYTHTHMCVFDSTRCVMNGMGTSKINEMKMNKHDMVHLADAFSITNTGIQCSIIKCYADCW